MTVTRPPTPNNDGATPTSAPALSTSRLIWTSFAVLTGIITGATAGLLSAAGGMPIPLAVLAGGAAFGSTIPLVLALLRYVAGDA